MVKYENMLVFSDKLKEQEQNARDSIIAANEFPYAAHQFTKWAHTQVANKTGIPLKYYQKMQEEAPELLVNNVDTWLKKSDKKFLIRELDGKVRAVLSDRYLPFSNRLACNTVALAIHETKQPFEILRQWITDCGMYLTIVTPTKYDLGNGDTVQLGMQIRNSEVGWSRFEVQSFMFRHACKNGTIFGKDEIGSFAKVHLGQRMKTTGYVDLSETTKRLDIATTVSAVHDIVKGTFQSENFEVLIGRIKGSKEIAVDDKVTTVNLLKEQAKLSDELEKKILSEFYEPSLYGLSNAITATARQQETEEAQVELEELGGKVLLLTEEDFKRAYTVKEK